MTVLPADLSEPIKSSKDILMYGNEEKYKWYDGWIGFVLMWERNYQQTSRSR